MAVGYWRNRADERFERRQERTGVSPDRKQSASVTDHSRYYARRAASPVATRLKEAEGRSTAVTEFRMGMLSAQVFLITASKQFENDTAAGELSKYTETELKAFESSIQSNEKWLATLLEKQEALAQNQDAILTISELDRRRRELSSQLTILQTKRPPRRVKKSTAVPSSSSTTSSSSASAETAFSTTSVPPKQTPSVSSETPDQPPRDEL